MELYLNSKIESIPVFKELLTLLKGVLSNKDIASQLKDLSDIESVQHLYDPVRDFLDFYILTANLDMDEYRKDYIVNALYAAKGAPKIFEVFEECFDTKIVYIYEFPILTIIEFVNLKINDVIAFINKFINMLYYLLYFTDITIHIKNLILSLQGQLVQYNAALALGYDYYKIEVSEDGLNH